MISDYGFVNILSAEEVDNVIKEIDLLEDKWTKRSISEELYFYTLGAFTYIDKNVSESQYYENVAVFNDLLKEKFGFVHDKVLSFFQEKLGPAEYEQDLALPGFHIFGYKKNEIDSVKDIPDVGLFTNIHKDEIFKLNEKALSKYDVVESDLLTFTIPISLQNGGGSVVIWDRDVLDIDSNTEYAQRIKSFDPKLNFYNEAVLAEHPYDVPTVVEYNIGQMFYIIGNPLHQIGFGLDVKKTDRRITLQGHALKCDGVWRIHL